MSGVRVLCVCSHNQTRSVMAAALLGQHLRDADVPAIVESAGITGGGSPATEETVRLLDARGLDVRSHRSRRIDDELSNAADLIVTAEHAHVVQIAGRTPALFRRTFTLPELVERSNAIRTPSPGSLTEWLDAVAAGRPAAFDYLDAKVGEIADPTGRSKRDWTEAFTLVDDLTNRLAGSIATVAAVTGTVPGDRGDR